MLENGADANAKGGELGNALQQVSFGCNETIIKLLLQNGADDVNAEGGKYGNALQAAVAAYQDNVVTVKLLFDNGAEVNAKGGIMFHRNCGVTVVTKLWCHSSYKCVTCHHCHQGLVTPGPLLPSTSSMKIIYFYSKKASSLDY